MPTALLANVGFLPYDVRIMTRSQHANHRVKDARLKRGWTQAELAERAGVSRTAVTAIEGSRLIPSVAAALALADALQTSVEDLFGPRRAASQSVVWAQTPTSESTPCWQAEVNGKVVCYPSGFAPMWTPLPDVKREHRSRAGTSLANDTLVMACCDPAAGLLATQYAVATGLRLLVWERSSRQAAELLRDGLVHLAGLHLSTRDAPDRNAEFLRETLNAPFQLVRLARWQEGIVLPSTNKLRSVKGAIHSRLTWIGREPGSGARQCLDRLLEGQTAPRCITHHHQGVIEAVASGWADAGVCVELASVAAGLRFLPVQEEAYDVCIPQKYADDRRVKAFVQVIRSKTYRQLIGNLPGYNTSETGDAWNSIN